MPAVYSSENPAFGVGAANVPVSVERTANAGEAARDIMVGKCFDNDMACASEQSVVVDAPLGRALREQFRSRGGYFLSAAEAGRLSRVVVTRDGRLNPAVVGKSAALIALMAGGVGRDFPLSVQKLSPILAFYVEEGTQQTTARCREVLSYGGPGHTAGIHTRSRRAAVAFGEKMPVSRVVVNTSTAHGALGLSTALALVDFGMLVPRQQHHLGRRLAAASDGYKANCYRDPTHRGRHAYPDRRHLGA